MPGEITQLNGLKEGNELHMRGWNPKQPRKLKSEKLMESSGWNITISSSTSINSASAVSSIKNTRRFSLNQSGVKKRLQMADV